MRGPLNPDELEIVREGFRQKRSAHSVAKQLGCSKRAIYDRYAKLRGATIYKYIAKKPEVAKMVLSDWMVDDRGNLTRELRGI